VWPHLSQGAVIAERAPLEEQAQLLHPGEGLVAVDQQGLRAGPE
jgi:hypothetical protein